MNKFWSLQLRSYDLLVVLGYAQCRLELFSYCPCVKHSARPGPSSLLEMSVTARGLDVKGLRLGGKYYS